MAEILHFEILRKHGQTNTHTHKHTDMGITIPRPPPMGGEVTPYGGRGNKMSLYSFCSDNINEAVLILGKGVGVTFVSKGLGVLGKRFHFNEIR